MQQVMLGRTGRSLSRIGLGAMQLSIQGRPDRATAKRVVQRAAQLGVTLIDTADAYCLDERDVGHNERLIREALDEIGVEIGLAAGVVVATKGGVVRTRGEWNVDASPSHLREACAASLAALSVERIDLYQLHAPDPRVPFEESVGELARLLDEGQIAAVGLSNVSLGQIQAATAIVAITSVQNRYNPWDRRAESEGILGWCDANAVTFLPYGPVGGRHRVARLRESTELRQIGREVGASPEELVLAWILSRSPSLVPIPGASRVESIESSVRAEGLALDPPTLERVERAFESLSGS